MLSVIDNNDQTFGNLGGGRVVVLRGTTTVSQLFSPNLFDINGWLKTGLENRGFSVHAVRVSPAGWIGYANNIELELYAYNYFSAEDVRVSAMAAIESITANYGLNRVFSDTTLSVVADGNAPGGLGGGFNFINPPSSYDQTGGQTVPDGRPKDDFWTALGLTTPFAVLAAGVILLVVLKK